MNLRHFHHSLFLLLLLSLLLGTPLSAQVSYGTITYQKQTVYKLKKEMEASGVKDKISETLGNAFANGTFDRSYVATFTPEAFHWREQPTADKTLKLPGGGEVTVLGSDFQEHRRTNPTDGTYLNSVQLAQKPFLVSGTATLLPWKLLEEDSRAGATPTGIDLRFATAVTETGDTLLAGYAPSLPVRVGPENYYGLPGAILLLQVKNGGREFAYVAQSIDLLTEEPELTDPAEGKPVDAGEFLRTKNRIDQRKRKTFTTFNRQ